MSMVYVRFRLDHPIFRETLRQVPEAELQWVRNTPTSTGSRLLFWASVEDGDAFRRAVADDPTVEEVVRTIPVDDRYLCQVELTESGTDTDLYPILLDTASVVRDATVTVDGWDCHFGFADSAAIARFFDTAREQGIDFEIDRVYEPRRSDDFDTGLTAAQREALVTALELGYFEVPRTEGLETLGEKLDISDTAASERIRRGTRSLITNVVLPDIESADELSGQ
ncbi:Transcriptional regulator, contains HTH domain [Halanaeroarchaeum sp. HSR-CO]|uniref:helix-turn-helix domain-containing protein n=1 Tax=Halanaeroarchaeum sp. HSR-CO TaxID=2866382 RepID=UPI00217D15AA|nr:helix-turn-helix domain-containing protein [Halanaeroarchaeum sp. HSR-CO]UWG46835.1 Transcriptional regulator, contains HTH domain [Halanaeroarchaeum sp. HSR-CO]